MDKERKETKTISEYISGFPREIQAPLRALRQTIKRAAPDTQETIKYRIPTFTLHGTNLVHFAAFKHHIGLYPTSSATKKFAKELSRYDGAKGTVRFPLGTPIPLSLIRRIVQFRVKEVALKKKIKG